MVNLNGIGGVWPASLTPFDAQGGIDMNALTAHIRHLADTPGVRAVVVNGHAGETTSLDAAERRAVVAAARAAAPATTGIVAGVVADDTRGACALARDAADAGADALLLFPPALFAGGVAMRPAMALAFVQDVAAASGLPIVLFQLSMGSGLGYPTDLLARLCQETPSIIAVKEGSDLPATYEDNLAALRGCGRRITVLTTNNTWLLASLGYGADGILSGIGSVAPGILADMVAAQARGDHAAALQANARLLPLTRVFYRRPSFDMHNRMKVALHLMGLLPNPAPRKPLLPIEPAETAAIRTALVASGLLPA